MIKFHEKYFIQSIPYEQVNPSQKQSTDFRNIHNIENKLTGFQIYQEPNSHANTEIHFTKHNILKY